MTPVTTQRGPIPMAQAFRVNCYRQGPRAVCGLSEWHATLAIALAGLAEHQQKPWSSVALVPQFAQAPHQEQLGLALEDHA